MAVTPGRDRAGAPSRITREARLRRRARSADEQHDAITMKMTSSASLGAKNVVMLTISPISARRLIAPGQAAHAADHYDPRTKSMMISTPISA
jgi:hypothetical protein